MSDKALSLVGAIMDAYKAAEQSGASALASALDCGKNLNLAMETVGNGKWKKWREQHLPGVSEETERVYRRLAGAVAKKDDIFAKCKSIRDALSHLSGLDKDLNPKPERPKKPKEKTGSTAAALEPPETDKPSSGLKAELDNAAVDDIIANVDEEMIVDLTKQSVSKLGPEKVCAALISSWTPDQLADLVKRVSSYLSRRPARNTSSVMASPAL